MQKLLNSQALKEGQSIGFNFLRHHLLAVRKQGKAHVYVNQCPHLGVNLEWQPHVFLDHAEEYIQCSTHGALFEIHNGYCIHGPCQGHALTPFPCHEFDGAIWHTD